jgi:DNA-binding NtrC family response regulator
VLVPGDVITICSTTLAYYAPMRRRREARVLEIEAFYVQVASELDRALAAGRRVGIMVIQLGPGADAATQVRTLAAALRPHDVIALDGATRVIAVLPEVDADELEARAAALHALAPGARSGGALAPDDGGDAAVVIGAARDAVAAALAGGHASAARSVRRVTLDTHCLLLAEPAMLRMYALVERIARTHLPVLVLGESGVGKELVAEAIQHLSPRRGRPQIAVNCAALPEPLAESVLFGHERGAFSGAITAQAGQFEAAEGGTLFLDEIGELSLGLQAKLLRAVDGKTIQRLGATKARPIDVRVVAATNRDLRAEVAAGRFREDLYYRLSGALLHVPPLRERPREVPVLARAFLGEACERLEREVPEISVLAMEAIARHPWPGNVRELRHAMQFAAAASDGTEIETWHLPDGVVDEPESDLSVPSVTSTSMSVPTRFRPIAEELRELERRRMIQALTATGGVQARAAELLRMPRRTFVAKMREYELHALFPRT